MVTEVEPHQVQWDLMEHFEWIWCLCECVCVCKCLCECWCWSGAAGDTSWVRGPLTITPTHCCHLSLRDKPWFTLEHHHWTFCCVGVRLQQGSIDWMRRDSTVSCRNKVTVTTAIAISLQAACLWSFQPRDHYCILLLIGTSEKIHSYCWTHAHCRR